MSSDTVHSQMWPNALFRGSMGLGVLEVCLFNEINITQIEIGR